MENNLKVRPFGAVNWIGLWTLYEKEVGRFLKVWSQTLLGPVVSSLLFIIVFSVALGAGTRMVGEVPYLSFLVPGLIMMTMIQNAFANSSSSIIGGKMQGSITDVLLPPLSANEFLMGYAGGAVTRGLLCGASVLLAISFWVDLSVSSAALLLYYALVANTIMALLGLIAGIWAEKFDQVSAVTNFVVTPLSFLSGTFYTLDRLPPFWQKLSQFNPFFYMIDGFRTGFIGQSEGSLLIGSVYVLAIATLLWVAALALLRSGYKLKA